MCGVHPQRMQESKYDARDPGGNTALGLAHKTECASIYRDRNAIDHEHGCVHKAASARKECKHEREEQ